MPRDADKAAPHRPALLPYLKEVRPYQWVKNLLIFVPMLAAHRLNAEMFSASLVAFAAFCLIASSVYVLNDLLDIEADLAHPRKRHRPVASGAVPVAHARWLAGGLLVSGFGIAASGGAMLVLVAAGYYAATLAYSLFLKRQPIIDIWVLAGLYTSRILAGAAATGIPLSIWLLAFSSFFFAALAAVKRQAELVEVLNRGKTEAAGRGYNASDLPLISQIAVASGYVAVLVLALYLETPTVDHLYAFRPALFCICAILFYWITRAVLFAHRGLMHDDPIVFAFHDRVSLLCMLAIVGSFFVAAMGPLW
ncbi:MAG: UbiA family prenyltransferase [Albidovulum sp.]